MEKVFFIYAFSVLLVQVYALDDVLITQSILYGISYLANDSSTLCQQELGTFFNAVEEKHVWALKGKFLKEFLYVIYISFTIGF